MGDKYSVMIRKYSRRNLQVPYHYHPEHEIVWIENGKGKLIVDDIVVPFTGGEIFLLGGGVPHLFISDPDAVLNTKERMLIWVVQFREKLFDNLAQLPEFHHAYSTIIKMQQGLRIKNGIKYSKYFIELHQAIGIHKLNTLNSFLDTVGRNGKSDPIATDQRNLFYNDITSKRIQQVQSFISQNYHKEITVDDAAKKIHLSKTSFCRFLKKYTNKTFSELLNEVRIAHACRLLRETTYTIARIGYDVGFNNLSYFYRQFRLMQNLSPHEYRQQYSIPVDEESNERFFKRTV
jgi:AraC-like DNA-binding protein